MSSPARPPSSQDASMERIRELLRQRGLDGSSQQPQAQAPFTSSPPTGSPATPPTQGMLVQDAAEVGDVGMINVPSSNNHNQHPMANQNHHQQRGPHGTHNKGGGGDQQGMADVLPTNPTAIAAFQQSEMGKQAAMHHMMGGTPQSGPLQQSHPPRGGAQGPPNHESATKQHTKQQRQLADGAAKVRSRPTLTGTRAMKPWPLVDVPQIPPDVVVDGDRPTTMADLTTIPDDFTFSAYDHHLTQHYCLEAKAVAVTVGATRYLEHHNDCGPYSSYRFQVCHNYSSGRCRKGAECTYLHMTSMPEPQLVHVLRLPEDEAKGPKGGKTGKGSNTNGGGAAAGGATGEYPMLQPGIAIPVYAPHSNEPPQIVPSEKIIKTEGSRLLLTALAGAGKGDANRTTTPPTTTADEEAVADQQQSQSSITEIPEEARRIAGRPQHCAHFQFRKVCNRGAACSFIHSTVPLQRQGRGSGGGGRNRSAENSQHQQPTEMDGERMNADARHNHRYSQQQQPQQSQQQQQMPFSVTGQHQQMMMTADAHRQQQGNMNFTAAQQHHNAHNQMQQHQQWMAMQPFFAPQWGMAPAGNSAAASSATPAQAGGGLWAGMMDPQQMASMQHEFHRQQQAASMQQQQQQMAMLMHDGSGGGGGPQDSGGGSGGGNRRGNNNANHNNNNRRW